MLCAILIADMADMELITRRDGADQALALVKLFYACGREVVADHGGSFVSAWADNFMASFPTVRQAEQAAYALIALVPSSVGIGWGVVIEDLGSLWGVPVIEASRLGEEIARTDDVLLSEAAKRALADGIGL